MFGHSLRRMDCLLIAWVFAAVAVMLLFHGSADAASIDTGKITSPGGYKEILSKAQAKGKVRLIVGVSAPFSGKTRSSGDDVTDRHAEIRNAQDKIVSGLATAGLKAISTYKYEYIPYLAMTVDKTTLEALLALPDVVGMEEDVPEPPNEMDLMLHWNVTLIGAPTLHSSGITGAGVVVGILDTGIDKNHPYLSGAVVSEACYSSDIAEYSSSSVCPGGVSESIDPGSAMPYGGNCPPGECDHGTHVAGIAAGRDGVAGSPGPGVAPLAGVIAVQVFSRFEASYCGGAPCVLSWISDQIKGLERIYALRSSFPIAALNMSLGGGMFGTNCDSDSRKAIIDLLRDDKIASIISSGNWGYCGFIGSPACISTAISVGATTIGDGVADYSNSASFLSVLAPGSSINSSIPNSAYATWNGTSMAAPHVTGAWALIRQGKPTAAVDEILAAFTSTGTDVTDTKCTTVTKKRIDVLQASAALGSTALLTVSMGGNKQGTVSADGLVCNGTVCTGVYRPGTEVSITAQPRRANSLDLWTGCDSASATTCGVTMNRSREVGADFNAPPALSLSPASLNFGAQQLNPDYAPTKTVTLTNKGASHLWLSRIGLSGANAAEFDGTTDCPVLMAKGVPCTVTISPAPATYGTKAARIDIASNDPRRSTAVVKLTANIVPPRISMSPAGLTFSGKAGIPTTAKKITIRNMGTSDLTIESWGFRGGNPSFFKDSTTCGGALTKNQFCDIFIGFTALGAGAVTDWLDVVSNDPANPKASVKVTGMGRK